MNLRVNLSLETLSSSIALLLVGGEATHLLDHVPHELGMLGKVPTVEAVPNLAHVLGYLLALLEATAIGEVQSHGSSMAPAVEGRPLDILFHLLLGKALPQGDTDREGKIRINRFPRLLQDSKVLSFHDFLLSSTNVFSHQKLVMEGRLGGAVG